MSSAADTAEEVERLRRKLEEYERSFRLVDQQSRVLERERQKLSAIVNHTDMGFLAVDPTLRVVWANETSKRILARTPDAGPTVGSLCQNALCHEPSTCASCPAARALRSGRVEHHELVFPLGEQERILYVTAIPLPSPSGEIDQAMVMVQDVSDLEALRRSAHALRESEERLRQSQKMEAIGTLAGGIAHDFNNILAGILGHAELLKLEARPGERAYRAADVIQTAARRAAELTKQLLGFARKGKIKSVAVDLHATIEDVVRLLGRILDKKINVVDRSRTDAAMVLGDPGQIHQVMLNLAVNARDAMPDGGELRFETDRVFMGADTCRRENDIAPGEYVRVTVSDTGCGIHPEIVGRIFEPFFTTKEQGKGTGMGLAMVYGIVRNHGGTVEVDSRPGAGTTFRIYLPVAVQDALARADAVVDTESTRGTGIVLVVDDEESVRAMAAEFLTHLGYGTLTAANGLDALETYARHGDEIDLVLLDMAMPLLGGPDCFRAMKKINPRVRAVLSTGYGLTAETTQTILAEGMAGFLQKPYELSELSRVVAAAMEKGSGTF